LSEASKKPGKLRESRKQIQQQSMGETGKNISTEKCGRKRKNISAKKIFSDTCIVQAYRCQELMVHLNRISREGAYEKRSSTM
jgi:hypothetical protein